MPDLAVDVQAVVKEYAGRRVVDEITFSVTTGEVVAVVGPNGAGKTTTIEILEGLRSPDSGTVSVLGRDPARGGPTHAGEVGVVLQEGGLNPGLKPHEALRQFAAFYPDPLDVGPLLDALDLPARTSIRHLSGGERRRVSLALAIVGRPRLLFLDEPTAGMDPRSRRTAWDTLTGLRGAGTTVVLTTHSMEEAETLADRVAVVDHGRLVALGTPDELRTTTGRAATHFTATRGLDTERLAARLGLDPGEVGETGPGSYTVDAEGTPDLVAALAAWLAEEGAELSGLRAGLPTLEDVFLRLTSEDADDHDGPATPGAQ